MKYQRLKPVLAVLVISLMLPKPLEALAAPPDVGEVSAFEFTFFPTENYTTTFTGSIPKSTPVKRVVKADWREIP